MNPKMKSAVKGALSLWLLVSWFLGELECFAELSSSLEELHNLRTNDELTGPKAAIVEVGLVATGSPAAEAFARLAIDAELGGCCRQEGAQAMIRELRTWKASGCQHAFEEAPPVGRSRGSDAANCGYQEIGASVVKPDVRGVASTYV